MSIQHINAMRALLPRKAHFAEDPFAEQRLLLDLMQIELQVALREKLQADLAAHTGTHAEEIMLRQRIADVILGRSFQ